MCLRRRALSKPFAIQRGPLMKALWLSMLWLLALLCGCHSAATFQPAWLSEPRQVVYSSEYEGNVRVKLKAKITQPEFVAAADRLKLIPHAEDSEYAVNAEVLGWKRGPDKQWDPLPDVKDTRISHHLNLWETAKYENGFLYYQMIDLEK